MGLLDDAIREHLELKRKHGADPDDVARQEQEALGQGGPRAEFAQPATTERPPAEPEPEGEPGIAEEPSEGHPAAAPTASPGGSSPAAPVDTPGGSSPASPRDEDPWL